MTYEVPLPRVLDESMHELRRLNATDATVTLNIMPLSVATITMPDTEELPMRSWVEMYTSQGSAGVYRVHSPGRNVGQHSLNYQLDHGVVEIGDYILKTDTEYKGAANTVIQQIFGQYGGSKWQLGTVTPTDKVAYSGQGDDVLSALCDVLGQIPEYMMTFDQSTMPWTLNVVHRPTTVSGEGRISRNVASAKISEDDTELCTRLYGDFGHIDADTIGMYGVVEKYAEKDDDETDAEYLESARRYLELHKQPIISITIDLLDLQQITGEALDGVTIGALYRLALPKYGETYQQTVVALNWGSVYGNPGAVSVSLAHEEKTLSTGVAASNARSKRERTRMQTRFVQTRRWMTETGEILHEAGLEFDSEHVLLFAKDVGALGEMHSSINVQAGQIALKVSKDGVISAINVTPEAIKIQAQKINLEGYVTATEFEAEKVARAEEIQTANLGATSIYTGSISTSVLTLNTRNASWQSQFVLTSINSQVYTFKDGDGNNFSVLGLSTSGTQNGRTIYYLGR